MGCLSLPTFLTNPHTSYTTHRRQRKEQKEARRQECQEALRISFGDSLASTSSGMVDTEARGPSGLLRSGSNGQCKDGRKSNSKSEAVAATVTVASATNSGPESQTQYMLAPPTTRGGWATEAEDALRAVKTWSWADATTKKPVPAPQPPMAQIGRETNNAITTAHDKIFEPGQSSQALLSPAPRSLTTPPKQGDRISRKCSLAPPQVVMSMPQFSVAPRTKGEVVVVDSKRNGSGSSAESEMDARRMSEGRAFSVL